MSNERALWKGGELRPAKKREFFGAWLSLVERFVRDEEVARSNRVAPKFPQSKDLSKELLVLKL